MALSLRAFGALLEQISVLMRMEQGGEGDMSAQAQHARAMAMFGGRRR